jgi:Domain of unknown function (DUF397)
MAARSRNESSQPARGAAHRQGTHLTWPAEETQVSLTHANWHKSSYSTQNASCVEVARTRGAAAVADHGTDIAHTARSSLSAWLILPTTSG